MSDPGELSVGRAVDAKALPSLLSCMNVPQRCIAIDLTFESGLASGHLQVPIARRGQNLERIRRKSLAGSA
jgi:hypothetical protein